MLRADRLFKMQDLQDQGRRIVEKVEDGPVGLTRNGDLIAGVVSVRDLTLLARARELRERAIWLFAAERGFQEIAEDKMRGWQAFAKELRTRLGD